MRYGYKRPDEMSFSLAAGDAPAFATDIRLGNSQPSEQTVITGAFKSTPSVLDYVDILCDWTDVQPLGVVGIFNVSIPVGTKLLVEGRKLGDGGYGRDLGANSTTQTMGQLPDGRHQALVFCDLPDTDFIGIRIRIYNNLNGLTWADETTDLYIGEIAPYACIDLFSEPARTRARSTRSLLERAGNAAAHRMQRGEFRSGEWNIHGPISQAYTDPVSWTTLQAMQDGKNYRALVIPRGISDYGQAPDYDLINQTALFAVVDWGDIQEESRGVMYAGVKLRAEETP